LLSNEHQTNKQNNKASPTTAAAPTTTPASDEPLAVVGNITSFDALITAIDKLPVQKTAETSSPGFSSLRDPPTVAIVYNNKKTV